MAETGALGGGQTPQPTGPIPVGGGVVTAPLSGCPCQLTMVSIDAPLADTSVPSQSSGGVTLSDLSVRLSSGGGWTPVSGALASTSRCVVRWGRDGRIRLFLHHGQRSGKRDDYALVVPGNRGMQRGAEAQ